MKKFIFILLRYSGLTYLFRELLQKNKVTILMFHDISKETAEKSFEYLLNEYNVIGLNVFIDACENKNRTKLPKKAVIITFDDGHIRNYQMLPVIAKYRIPVTIFLCSEIINTNRHYWFKYDHFSRPKTFLKGMNNFERMEAMEKDGFKHDQEYSQPQALSKSQILEMSKLVNFQSHTMFHPCLDKCNKEVAYNELFNSKQSLENVYGFKINSIAYPNGDYSDETIELTKKAGYLCGLTVDSGLNTIETNLFKLKRYSVNDASDLNEFIVKSSGLWSFVRRRVK